MLLWICYQGLVCPLFSQKIGLVSPKSVPYKWKLRLCQLPEDEGLDEVSNDVGDNDNKQDVLGEEFPFDYVVDKEVKVNLGEGTKSDIKPATWTEGIVTPVLGTKGEGLDDLPDGDNDNQKAV